MLIYSQQTRTMAVDSSLTPSQHVWSSGFLRRGSDGMELASTLTTGPCSVYRQLQIGSENSSFRNAVGTRSALEALRDVLYRLITWNATNSIHKRTYTVSIYTGIHETVHTIAYFMQFSSGLICIIVTTSGSDNFQQSVR